MIVKASAACRAIVAAAKQDGIVVVHGDPATVYFIGQGERNSEERTGLPKLARQAIDGGAGRSGNSIG